MEQMELFTDTRNLFEKLCSYEYLREGFKQVKKNHGSPGIDKVTIQEYEGQLERDLKQLKEELISWTYKPKPVRRVEIPKDDPGAGVRLIGVPCIRDRVVHATLKILLEPILDPTFSKHSYGFRPGCNQRQAVEAAQKIVQSGKEYVVDIDLSKFFDRVNHDRLIARLAKMIPDKRILRLIGMILRSGVMSDGVVIATTEGTTQGSPLSPLLSNVVLDELDKELEARGVEFCRFADDCNLFAKSKTAAKRIMANTRKFIEKKLKLVVNEAKSKVTRSKFVKFLGMTIMAGTIAISTSAMNKGMAQVKELIPRGTSAKREQTMEKVNQWYWGWSEYFQMTQYPSQLEKIEAHVRRRFRAQFVDQQKTKRNLFEKLTKNGIPGPAAAKAVYGNKKRWALSHTTAIEAIYSNAWFKEKLGQKIRSQQKQTHWFDRKKWIKIP